MAISPDQEENRAAPKLTFVNPEGLFDPRPYGYSQAVISPPNSRIVYISGQGGADDTGVLSSEFEAQVKQAYSNLAVALDGVGAKLRDVTNITVYVVDHDESKLGFLTTQVSKVFGEALPAQTLVPVPRLVLDGMLFEIEATAVLG